MNLIFIFNSVISSLRIFALNLSLPVVLGLFTTQAFAAQRSLTEAFTGFVEVSPGRELFVIYQPPTRKGFPILTLVNGLTYETTHWWRFAHELQRLGYGVLRYDAEGMGKTLNRRGWPRHAFRIEDQADDLARILEVFGQAGQARVVGLSYGGGLSLVLNQRYPSYAVENFLMAPYTEPLKSQNDRIRGMMLAFRSLYPWYPISDDDLYDYYLRLMVYTEYPFFEPTISNALKAEAVFQLIRGIRKFDLYKTSQSLPPDSVHLLIAGLDQYIPRSVLLRFWAQVPAGAKVSLTTVLGSEHKKPEAVPRALAEYIDYLIHHRAELKSTSQYFFNPFTGYIFEQKSPQAELHPSWELWVENSLAQMGLSWLTGNPMSEAMQSLINGGQARPRRFIPIGQIDQLREDTRARTVEENQSSADTSCAILFKN